MAHVQPIVRVELDPMQPVPEICAVIMAVTPYHPGQEEAVLIGVKDAVEARLQQLKKGAEANGKQIREPDRTQQNQGRMAEDQPRI